MLRPGIEVGDDLWFPHESAYFTVQARNDRYLIVTRETENGDCMYSILDLKENVRGPDDSVFGSDYTDQEQCEERLEELENGEIEISHKQRNRVDMDKAIFDFMTREEADKE